MTTGNQALARKPFYEKLTDPSGGYCYRHINATSSEKRIS